jgi:hypothetical protein
MALPRRDHIALLSALSLSGRLRTTVAIAPSRFTRIESSVTRRRASLLRERVRFDQVLHRGAHARPSWRARPRAPGPSRRPTAVPSSVRSLKSPRVADAEHLARELGEPGAERHVEFLQDDLAQAVGVMAFGHQHRPSATRNIPPGPSPEPRVPSRAPRDASLPRGAGDAQRRLSRTLFVEHAQGFAQAIQQVRRRRVRKYPSLFAAIISSQSQKLRGNFALREAREPSLKPR